MEMESDIVIEVAGVATKKRARAENWLDQDKLLLKELVRERVRAIENKNTDTNSNKKKKDAWADLHTTFNSICTGVQRTISQLKTQWSVMKVAAKKEKAQYRRESNRTGGGPCPEEPGNQAADDISSWLPHEFSVDTNDFDCDGQAFSVSVPVDLPTQGDNKKEPVKPPDAGNLFRVHKIKLIPAPLEMVPAPLEVVTAPLEVVPASLEVEDPLEEEVASKVTAANSSLTDQKKKKRNIKN